jgi:hypothetical protein
LKAEFQNPAGEAGACTFGPDDISDRESFQKAGLYAVFCPLVLTKFESPPKMRPTAEPFNEEGTKLVALRVDSPFAQRLKIIVPHYPCLNQFVARCIGCIGKQVILALLMTTHRVSEHYRRHYVTNDLE